MVQVSDFSRVCRTLLLARLTNDDPEEIARRLYPESNLYRLMSRKSAVAVTDSTGDLFSPAALSSAFADSVNQAAIIGRIPTPISVPLVTQLPHLVSRTAFAFFGQGQPMAAHAPAFGSVFLDHKKVGGMVIFSRELLNTSRAEAVIDREMRSALVSAQDEHLLNPTFSATAARPASVTYGRTEIDATGATSAADVDGVVGDLLAALAGANFEFCSFITTHTNALALSLMRDTSGARAYPEIGVSGGRLAGLPLIASGSAPADVLTLLDSSELLLGDQEELEIQASTAAFISASDDPGSENVWVPLFTTENVALAATRYLNWSLRRPHCAFASAFAPAAPAWQS